MKNRQSAEKKTSRPTIKYKKKRLSTSLDGLHFTTHTFHPYALFVVLIQTLTQSSNYHFQRFILTLSLLSSFEGKNGFLLQPLHPFLHFHFSLAPCTHRRHLPAHEVQGGCHRHTLTSMQILLRTHTHHTRTHHKHFFHSFYLDYAFDHSHIHF